MTDNPGVTEQDRETVRELCREWKLAGARLAVEVLEAGDDEEAVAAACQKADDRMTEIFERIDNDIAHSFDDVFALLGLAIHVLETDGDPDRERVASMIRSVTIGLARL